MSVVGGVSPPLEKRAIRDQVLPLYTSRSTWSSTQLLILNRTSSVTCKIADKVVSCMAVYVHTRPLPNVEVV